MRLLDLAVSAGLDDSAGLDVSAGLAFSIGLTTPERVFELDAMPDRIVFLRRFAALDTRTPLGI